VNSYFLYYPVIGPGLFSALQKEIPMNQKTNLFVSLVLVLIFLLVSCANGSPVESSAKGSANLAKVDGVVVETINEHQYAVVNGTYPDPCTRISEINQDVDGNRFVISLSTDKPDDLVCAMMLASYEVTLLLETGGLTPGEYRVEINGVEASFSIGQ
jgi:hypothetical protein